jgi:hypothetical protein
MGIEHENCDVGAEADTFREAIATFSTKIVKDDHDSGNNRTTIDYVNGEGDPPHIKYRLTLEAIGTVTDEEYEKLTAVEPTHPEQQQAAAE